MGDWDSRRGPQGSFVTTDETTVGWTLDGRGGPPQWRFGRPSDETLGVGWVLRSVNEGTYHDSRPDDPDLTFTGTGAETGDHGTGRLYQNISR